MRRRFIPDETGFTYYRLFTSYFIDGRVFFRTFTFYIVFYDLFLNWFLGTDHLIFVGVGRGVGNFFWVWIFFFSALLFAGILFHQNKSLQGFFLFLARRAWDRAPYSWNMVNLFSYVSTHRGDVIYLETVRWPVNCFVLLDREQRSIWYFLASLEAQEN